MSEKRIAQLERRVGELEAQNQRLRLRMEKLLSRKGGHMEGQLHIDGWIQLEEQTSLATPTADARIGVIDSGGVRQLIVVFSTGTVTVLGQE